MTVIPLAAALATAMTVHHAPADASSIPALESTRVALDQRRSGTAPGVLPPALRDANERITALLARTDRFRSIPSALDDRAAATDPALLDRAPIVRGLDASATAEITTSADQIGPGVFLSAPIECRCTVLPAGVFVQTGSTLRLPGGHKAPPYTMEFQTGAGRAHVTLYHGQTRAAAIDAINAASPLGTIEAIAVPETDGMIHVRNATCGEGVSLDREFRLLDADEPSIILSHATDGIPITEYRATNRVPMQGDTNCDDVIDLDDVVFTLQAWGTHDPYANHDQSGAVDFDDLLWLLDHWGPIDTSVIHVDASAAPGGDGRNWETAFRFLQDALDAVKSLPDGTPREIRVARGVYRPDQSAAVPEGTESPAVYFDVPPRVTVRGGWAGLGAADPDVQDREQFPTILSGDLKENDIPPFGQTVDNSWTIIRLRSASSLESVTVQSGSSGQTNASPAMAHSDTIMRNVIFARNEAREGGALKVLGTGVGGTVPARIVACTFVTNRADVGAAIHGTHLVVDRCVFDDCHATFGAGILRQPPLGGRVTITNSTFARTVAGAGGTLAQGDELDVINCSAFFSAGSGPMIDGTERTRIRNCLFDQTFIDTSIPIAASFTHCIADVELPGNFNRVADPRFVDPASGDLRLRPDSPAIDAGNTFALPVGRPFDVTGAPRVVNDPATNDTGVERDPGRVIDVGAHEFQPDG